MAVFALRKVDIELEDELGENHAQFGEGQLFSDATVASQQEWEPSALVQDEFRLGSPPFWNEFIGFYESFRSY